MYRDVLYHIFEGYSLFINEYDFEEYACTNNSEFSRTIVISSDTSILIDVIPHIPVYYIATFARENGMEKESLFLGFDGRRT